MTLTPIDTLKTTQQTQGGGAGIKLLRERISEKGVGSLWYGALATAAATFVGHCGWELDRGRVVMLTMVFCRPQTHGLE
jgi:hypothetical protein